MGPLGSLSIIAMALCLALPAAASASTGEITGTVTKASGGALQGAQVCADDAATHYYGGCSSTNAAGEYAISSLEEGTYKVQFSPPYGANYQTQYYNGKPNWEEADEVSVTGEETTPNINAAMQEGGKIKGKVTKASGGAALEGVQVCALSATGSPYEYGQCMTSNSSGEYTIAGLPAGSYKVRFAPGTVCTPTCTQQNYLTQYYNSKSTSLEADEVAVTVGGTVGGINAAMQAGGQIKGKVTKASGGAPLEGVQVCASIARYEYGNCTSTNSSGEYTITSLAAGAYKVIFTPSYGANYLTQYYNGKTTWEEADPVSVTAEATVTGINASMEVGGQIKGKVTKASGGAAIEGIEVCASGASYRCSSTDSSGEYTIAGLATGSYVVEFYSGYEGGNYVSQYYNGKATREEADSVSVTAESATTGVDAVLHEGGHIEGKVTSASGGAAIEGAEVCANAGEVSNCGWTNDHGEYTITGLPTGSYKVGFSANLGSLNYVTQYYHGKATWEEADPVAVTEEETTTGIDAVMHEGGQIKGKVTNFADGAALEGIVVCANESAAAYESGQHCTETDSTGDYILSGLAAGAYTVAFTPGVVCEGYSCTSQDYVAQFYNGKASSSEADEVSVTVGSTTTVDAAMHEGGSITGKVTKASGGAALGGAQVCAHKTTAEYEYPFHCASTNSSGEYRITGLATGSYRVSFAPNFGSNYLIQYYSGKTSMNESDPVSVTEEATTTGIDAALQTGGQIKGKVTAASGGGAITGIQVCAGETPGGYQYSHCTSTNSGGEYTIVGLPTGSYSVVFYAGYEGGNYLTQWYNGKSKLDEADPVSVTAGATTSNINAAMDVGGEIKGRVTKASGGAALEGAEVCATTASNEYGAHCASTNSSGKYTIPGLPSGSYKIEFSPPYRANYLRQFYSGKSTWQEADTVSVTAGSATGNIDAALQTGGKITGSVSKASGGAAEYVSVCAHPEIEEETTCVSTNASGEYSIKGLPSGSYKVSFSPAYGANYVAQWYSGKASAGEADAVAVTAGATTPNINASMQAGGRITGTVTAATGGAGIQGASICAYKPDEEEAQNCAETDAAGKYTLTGLPTGSYQVKFSSGWNCGPESCTENNYVREFYNDRASRAAADLVAVTAGTTSAGIDAALQSGGGISGHVTDASTGKPAAATVCAYRSGETEAESCTETFNGEYMLTGLSAGNHVVEFGPGLTCGPSSCTEGNYTPQFYDNKPSMATANMVSVTAGSVHEDIDAAMVEPSAPKPVNTALPQVTGTPAVGESLSCSNGTWENNPTEYGYAWLRDGGAVSGQTGSTYTVQSADQGHSLSCMVTATNESGSTSATSNALYVPAKPVNTTPPSLTGTPAVGETLSCSTGAWEHSPTSYAYLWSRGATAITGQSSNTYTVQTADQGYNISCEVTATNNDGSASATSNSLAVPAALGAPVNTSPPSLTGTPAVGQTLSCSNGSWENSPTSYAYAWRRDGTPISGQVTNSYTVQGADAGHSISCEVTAINSTGPGSATSNVLRVPAKPVSTGSPSLTGTPAVGQTLSCSNGSWENSPTSYAYAWRRDGTPISGQVTNSYTVQGADAGHSISCEVTASNGGGSASATSNAVGVPSESGGGGTNPPSGGGGPSPGGGGSPSTPSGEGSVSPPSTPSPPKTVKCKKGFRKKTVHGKSRCVKIKHHHGKHRR